MKSFLKYFVYVILLLALPLAGCSLPAQFVPTTTSTAENPPTRTPRLPTLAAASTQTQAADGVSTAASLEPTPLNDEFIDLFETINYTPGAGGPSDCFGPDQNKPLPQANFTGPGVFETAQQMRILCLYGFPQGEKVTITFIAPDGQTAAKTVYQSLAMRPVMDSPKKLTIIAVQFAPQAEPPGVWRIQAEGGGQQVEVTYPDRTCPTELMRADAQYHEDGPYLVTLRRVDAPQPVSLIDPLNFAPYQVGDTLRVTGACYPPGITFPVVISGLEEAFHQGMEMTFKKVVMVTPDTRGVFQFDLPLTGDLLFDGAGGYYTILPVPPGMAEQAQTAGWFNLVYLPFAGFQALPLTPNGEAWDYRRGDCHPTGPLSVGQALPISTPVSVYLYDIYSDEPLVYLATINADERVEILEGPRCLDPQSKTAFWQVHGLTTGIAGWVRDTELK